MTVTAQPPTTSGVPRTAFWRLTMVRHLGYAIVALGALYLITEHVDEYRNLQIATICYTAIAVAGLTGTSGQISLGQGAFMAVGAYTTAVVLEHQGWNIGWVIVISTVATAAFGAVEILRDMGYETPRRALADALRATLAVLGALFVILVHHLGYREFRRKAAGKRRAGGLRRGGSRSSASGWRFVADGITPSRLPSAA